MYYSRPFGARFRYANYRPRPYNYGVSALGTRGRRRVYRRTYRRRY